MMAVCPALPPGAGFLSSVLGFIDCQAQTLGGEGYQALAAPGSTLSLLLTGLLTIFVGLFGYRMLFGQTPVLRDGVLGLVKIGIVLALATSWTAYRSLVYDVALKGPAELAGEVGRPAALPGAGGGLVARLDFVDRALTVLNVLGAGDTTLIVPGATPPPGPGAQQTPGQIATAPENAPPSSSFDAIALGASRILFLAGALGSFASVRLVAGLLLALGPFFFAFLLFDGTRGLFEGWLRVLAGTALGALGSAIVLGVELAMLEPWLVQLLTLRAANRPIPGIPVELLVVTLVFDLALLAMLIAAGRVAFGFRLPDAWRAAPAQLAEALRGGEGRLAANPGEPEPAQAGRSRAAAVVDAVAASQRRESPPRAAMLAAAGAPDRQLMGHAARHDAPEPAAPAPLGQSFRRTRGRVSGSANRRDRT